MTVRSISQLSDQPSELRIGLSPVALGDRNTSDRVIRDLVDTMNSQPVCVGLAANQIGYSVQIAVIRRSEADPLVLINPEVLATSGKKDRKRESCMSLWGVAGEVERRKQIHIRYLDSEFIVREEHFSGFIARVIMHEVDHLNGILFSDHVESGKLGQTDIFEGYSPIAN